jgi:hypothetical protein
MRAATTEPTPKKVDGGRMLAGNDAGQMALALVSRIMSPGVARAAPGI